MEYLTLNNGVPMPLIGFGTFMLGGETCTEAVTAAIESGYRMIDTAEAYGNEKEVGEGIRRSGIDRWELFLVTKVNCNGVQREHNKKLNNGLPILHKVPPKRDYGRYFCIMAEKGGTSHGGLTEKLSPFFHAKKQEVNAYGR